jgi:hypothetical protein
MLHLEAIESNALSLLNKLMEVPEMRDFQLVGGTALALQIGHRLSVDLDLFTPDIDFDAEHLWDVLKQDSVAELIRRKDNWMAMKLAGVKVDVLKYPYELLAPVVEEEGIRLVSKMDIAPMKLSAIVGRGTKKDFFDIFFLLRDFSLHTMLELYTRKFRINNHFHVLKSLTYFEDAEPENDPVMLEKVTWKQVKKEMESQVREYVRKQ